MIISRTEIANAVAAYKTWEPQQLAFPSQRGQILNPHSVSWARTVYDRLPPLRDMLVRDLRGRIVAGRYFVPADQIVEKLLGRLVIDHIAV